MTTFGDTTAAAILKTDKQADVHQDLRTVPTGNLEAIRHYYDMSATVAEDFGDTEEAERFNRSLRDVDAELDRRRAQGAGQ